MIKIENKLEYLKESIKGRVKKECFGISHKLILTENGLLYGIGENRNGQLSRPVTDEFIQLYEINIDNIIGKIIDISCGGLHSILLTDKGFVYACGSNKYGQLGIISNRDSNSFVRIKDKHLNSRILGISAGKNHSAILTKNGNVYTFGENYEGQLGLGDRVSRDNPTRINKAEIYNNVVFVDCGDYNTVIVDRFNDVYICGQDGVKDGKATSPTLIDLEGFFGEIIGVKSVANKLLFVTDEGIMFLAKLMGKGNVEIIELLNSNITVYSNREDSVIVNIKDMGLDLDGENEIKLML